MTIRLFNKLKKGVVFMNDPKRQTGRTTQMLLKMLTSENSKNYYISLNQQMANYHFEMFLDILFKLSIPFTTIPNRCTVELSDNRIFRFVGKDFVTNRGFKEQPSNYFDHSCFGS